MTKVQASLATKHGKLAQIGPAFAEVLGWELILAEIDTDQFGSFDGSTPRLLTPKDAVLAKARAGAEVSGTRFGLASEGTIGSHPSFPLTTSDHELIGFVDLEFGTELVVSHLSPLIKAEELVVVGSTPLGNLAEKFDMPNHAVILRIDSPSMKRVIKGIRDPRLLEREIESARGTDADVRLRVESDFRAMCSPSRQLNIAECSMKAAARIATLCPRCGYFGFGHTGFDFGLRCSACGILNQRAVAADVNGCLRCDYTNRVERGLRQIAPEHCFSCNP